MPVAIKSTWPFHVFIVLAVQVFIIVANICFHSGGRHLHPLSIAAFGFRHWWSCHFHQHCRRRVQWLLLPLHFNKNFITIYHWCDELLSPLWPKEYLQPAWTSRYIWPFIGKTPTFAETNAHAKFINGSGLNAWKLIGIDESVGPEIKKWRKKSLLTKRNREEVL